jgi:hypothetical protein
VPIGHGVGDFYLRVINLTPSETKRKLLSDTSGTTDDNTTKCNFGTSGAAAWIICDPLLTNATKEGTGADPTPWSTAQNKGWKFDPDDLDTSAGPPIRNRRLQAQTIGLIYNVTASVTQATADTTILAAIYRIASGGGATLLASARTTFAATVNRLNNTLNITLPETILGPGESLQLEIWLKAPSIPVTGQTLSLILEASGVASGGVMELSTTSQGLMYHYQQTKAGSSTPSGGLLKKVKDKEAGSTTPTGAIRKLIHSRAARTAGSSTPTGAIRKLIHSRAARTAGSSTPTGALLKKPKLPRGGSTTPTGALTRRNVFKKLAGSTTPTGAIRKLIHSRAARTAGSSNPTGAIRKLIHSRAARTSGKISTLTGLLLKRPRKVLGGSISPGPGTITRRNIFKKLAGSTTPTAALRKFIAKRGGIFSGSTTPTGALRKKPGITLEGVIAPTEVGETPEETVVMIVDDL